MTMLNRVGSFNNEYFNSLIREYTDKGQRPESFGMSRAIMAYLDTNDSGVAMWDLLPLSQCAMWLRWQFSCPAQRLWAAAAERRAYRNKCVKRKIKKRW